MWVSNLRFEEMIKMADAYSIRFNVFDDVETHAGYKIPSECHDQVIKAMQTLYRGYNYRFVRCKDDPCCIWIK